MRFFGLSTKEKTELSQVPSLLTRVSLLEKTIEEFRNHQLEFEKTQRMSDSTRQKNAIEKLAIGYSMIKLLELRTKEVAVILFETEDNLNETSSQFRKAHRAAEAFDSFVKSFAYCFPKELYHEARALFSEIDELNISQLIVDDQRVGPALLGKEPGERFSSEEIIRHPWSRICDVSIPELIENYEEYLFDSFADLATAKPHLNAEM